MRVRVVLVLAAVVCLSAAAARATTFDHDRNAPPITNVVGTLGGELLTEGATPGAAPTVAITRALLRLRPGDDIDALSFGDDRPILGKHLVVFSVDRNSNGNGGVGFERSIETGSGTPPGACGDLFVQAKTGTTNTLAPAGWGYTGGTGDEEVAAWAVPSPNSSNEADDLDAFDFSDYPAPTNFGVFFSLAPESPSLLALGFQPGDILWSPLDGVALPIVAELAGMGAGSATAANLGIVGCNLDALNVADGWDGVIPAVSIGPAPNCTPGSSWALEYSIESCPLSSSFSGGDVLTLTGTSSSPVAKVFLRDTDLGLEHPTSNIDALEAVEQLPDVGWGPVSIQIPAGALGTPVLNPGNSSAIDLLRVGVKGPGGTPVVGAHVRIDVSACPSLCVDFPDDGLSGITDVDGNAYLNPRVGGCEICPVIVYVDGIPELQLPGVIGMDWDGLTADGRVDLADYTWFQTALGTGERCADYNQDGIVDMIDYGYFQQAYGSANGTCAPPATVGDRPISTAAPILYLGRNPTSAGSPQEIAFDLPADGRARLRVFGASGALKRELADRQFSAGRSSVAWDGRDGSGLDLPSGVYFLELSCENGRAVRKLITVR